MPACAGAGDAGLGAVGELGAGAFEGTLGGGVAGLGSKSGNDVPARWLTAIAPIIAMIAAARPRIENHIVAFAF